MGAERPSAKTPSAPARRPRVYLPREDTFLLLPYANPPSGSRLLEVGAGSGLLSMTAARAGARVVATDRNPAALRALRARALAESLDVEVVRTDLARGLGRFDRVLANPPYLPTRPEQRDPDPWVNLALDGGPDGTAFLDRLMRALPDHLAPGAEAFVLVSSLQAAGRLRAIAARWRTGVGSLSSVASRALEGERLEVWRLTRSAGSGPH